MSFSADIIGLVEIGQFISGQTKKVRQGFKMRPVESLHTIAFEHHSTHDSVQLRRFLYIGLEDLTDPERKKKNYVLMKNLEKKN